MTYLPCSLSNIKLDVSFTKHIHSISPAGMPWNAFRRPRASATQSSGFGQGIAQFFYQCPRTPPRNIRCWADSGRQVGPSFGGPTSRPNSRKSWNMRAVSVKESCGTIVKWFRWRFMELPHPAITMVTSSRHLGSCRFLGVGACIQRNSCPKVKGILINWLEWWSLHIVDG